MRYDARGAGALYLQNEIKLYQRILPGKLIAVWPLLDKSGAVARDFSGAGRNAAYTAPTLGRAGHLSKYGAPQWIVANSTRVNIFSSSFANAFNGLEGTVSINFRVRAASVLSDGVARYVFVVAKDGSNQVNFQRDAAINNGYNMFYVAGGVVKTVALSGITSLNWNNIIITWSKSGDAVKIYLNGVQQGSTQTGLGTWVGAPTDTNCDLGHGGAFWDGYIDWAAIWSAAMPAALVPYIARRRPHALAA